MAYMKKSELQVSQAKRKLMGLISSAPIFLIGCANIVPPCPGKTTPPYSELVGTQWELNRWNMPPNSMGEVRLRSLPNDGGPKIAMQFSQGRMSGFSGCNRFTAKINEDPRGFQIEQITTTRMACAPNREDIERDFLYLLRDYRSIARDGNYLLIIGPNREVLGFNLIQRTNP
jgi:heat shock protein HslJ